MVKMVVADDEEIERSALCFKITRNFPGIEICAQASDGEELLQAVREYQPDLVIVDIEMPVMNGLEAVEQIRRENLIPQAKILIYTAYSQFEYARQALREKVDDYILKPVPLKKLVEIISNALELLDREREERQSKAQQSRIFSEMRESVQREFLRSISYPGMDLRQMQRFQFVLGDEIARGRVVAFHISTDQPEEAEHGADEFRKAAARLCEVVRASGGMCGERIDRNLYAFFPAGPETENSLVEQQASIRRIEELIASSGQENGIHIRAGIGSIRSGHTGLYESYRESFRLLHLYSEKDAVLHIQDEAAKNAAREGRLLEESSLAEMIYMGEREELQKQIALAFLKSREFALSDLQHLALESMVRVISRLQESLKDRQQLQYAFPALCDGLAQTKNWRDIREWYVGLANALSLDVGGSKEHDGKKALNRALQYLGDHYQEDISLEAVAEAAGVSPGHLSHLFSDEIGINYSSYLAKYRIETAKKLLQTRDISVNELSQMVGFNSPGYFRKVFKKWAGCTVNEFRSRYY